MSFWDFFRGSNQNKDYGTGIEVLRNYSVPIYEHPEKTVIDVYREHNIYRYEGSAYDTKAHYGFDTSWNTSEYVGKGIYIDADGSFQTRLLLIDKYDPPNPGAVISTIKQILIEFHEIIDKCIIERAECDARKKERDKRNKELEEAVSSFKAGEP
jgi:hypothetical protein